MEGSADNANISFLSEVPGSSRHKVQGSGAREKGRHVLTRFIYTANPTYGMRERGHPLPNDRQTNTMNNEAKVYVLLH